LSAPLAELPELTSIVSQPALDALFHAHPAWDVTATDPLAAAAPMLAPAGESVYVQPPVAAKRKLATVVALLLWTRALSEVDIVPSGSGGLP